MDNEREVWRDYMARCAKIMTENTAGRHLNVEYADIINPKPQEHYKEGEIKNKIKAKLR